MFPCISCQKHWYNQGGGTFRRILRKKSNMVQNTMWLYWHQGKILIGCFKDIIRKWRPALPINIPMRYLMWPKSSTKVHNFTYIVSKSRANRWEGFCVWQITVWAYEHHTSVLHVNTTLVSYLVSVEIQGWSETKEQVHTTRCPYTWCVSWVKLCHRRVHRAANCQCMTGEEYNTVESSRVTRSWWTLYECFFSHFKEEQEKGMASAKHSRNIYTWRICSCEAPTFTCHKTVVYLVWGEVLGMVGHVPTSCTPHESPESLSRGHLDEYKVLGYL